MTNEEISRIKEHIEIHARREPRAIKITEIMWKAVDELEHIAEFEKEISELKQRNAELKGMYAHSAREAGTYKQFFEKMKCCGNCAHLCECGIKGFEVCKNYEK